MARMPSMRKTLSALLKEVRACFGRIEDPIQWLNQTDCLMSGLAVFGMKCLLKFDHAVHSDEAVLSSDAVRCRSRAVGHARTARRSGSAAIAALFHEAVPAFAARKGIGCLRTLRSFDRRNRIFFVGQGALSKLLRKTPWHNYLLSCWEPFWWVWIYFCQTPCFYCLIFTVKRHPALRSRLQSPCRFKTVRPTMMRTF